jgi:very-short-patch-repair endonuclease
MNKYGFELLEDQAGQAAKIAASEYVAEYAFGRDDKDNPAWGDTEIEKLFFIALWARINFGFCEYGRLVKIENHQHPSEWEIAESPADAQPAGLNLYIQRQVQLDNWRVDFVVFAFDFRGRVLKSPGWRSVIVECDGHDFHERTKQQAGRDRSRDRSATTSGRDVMRFTGSELWRNPWGCAGEIIDWATRSFG